MRILITGAAGFIGSHVTELLQEADHDIFLVDNLSTGKPENLGWGQFLKASILDHMLMNRVFNDFKPEIVVHLAAQPAISTSIKNPWLDFDTNVRGTMVLIQCCQAFGVKRMVFSSTSAVYDSDADFCREHETPLDPDSPYGISKVTAEMYIRHLLPDSVILRFGNVYGPRQEPLGENQLIARMIRHFEYGDNFYIHGDGTQSRDFVYVGDVAQAVLRSITTGSPGIYNIASGVSYPVNGIAKLFEMMYGVEGYKWEHDADRGERYHVSMDVNLAKEELLWTAKMPIHRGINLTLDWWKNRDQSSHKS